MKRVARLVFLLPGTLLGLHSGAAQDVATVAHSAPSGVGFQLPEFGGTLTYSLTASELISKGLYNVGAASVATNLGGNLAYASKSQSHPFSAVFSGGVLIGGSTQPTTTYQNLAFSQVLNTKHWNVVIADTPSFLPQSPSNGLSGIPGVGDLGVDPATTGADFTPGILTQYGSRFSNTVSGTVGRTLTRKLSMQGSAAYSFTRFLGDEHSSGLDNSSVTGSTGLVYQVGARSVVNVSYVISRFSYGGSSFTITSQGVMVGLSRRWTRSLSTVVSVGPQHISQANSYFSAPSTQLSASASASYAGKSLSSDLSYARGSNNGSGVAPGAFSDSLYYSLHRSFHRSWNVSGSVGFNRSTSISSLQPDAFSSKGVSASGQVSRALSRRMSGFVSYSITKQLLENDNNVRNAFNGFYQSVGFGITYSPRPILLGRR